MRRSQPGPGKVRAGLRIIEAIAELNGATPHLDLAVRAAVNSGEVLVVLGASPQAGEGLVTGDVVNTASRLQGVAPVGGVVGESTHLATKDFISYEPLDSVIVKGKPEPIPVWRALSPRSRLGVDRDVATTTPFIGRGPDLAALEDAYRRTVRERSVQLVTVAGEPGVGKTRLLAEFRSFIDDQDDLVSWRRGRSLPYGEGITFWALGEIVKAHAGILETDDPEITAGKLGVAIGSVVEDTDERAWLFARTAPLVGAGPSHAAGSTDKRESFTAWRRLLEAIASRGPFVAVFEDIHWADRSMLKFIDYMLSYNRWSAAWDRGDRPVRSLRRTGRVDLVDRRPVCGETGARRSFAFRRTARPLGSDETHQGRVPESAVRPRRVG